MNETSVTPLNVTSGLVTSVSTFMAQVYGWMTAGLLLTAGIAYLTVATNLFDWVYNPVVFLLLLLTEVIIVIGLSALAQKLNPLVAAGLFLFYAIINGLFFGPILLVYTGSSVFLAFAATGGTFMVMSIYGAVTKADLTKWGNLAFMGLIGLIIGIVINIFLQSSGLDWLLTFLGIGIFVVLIAYDTQRLKQYAQMAEGGSMSAFAVRGALSLYLDFINIFIRLLQIFGRRR